MISKNEVKYIISLSDKKNRDREGLFVAEGPKLVNELMANGIEPKAIYATQSGGIAFNTKPEIIRTVSPDELQRISGFETPNETLGIFYQRKLPRYELTHRLSLALDGIQDPGNLGTILRTADWFGITQIFASADTADCYNPKVVQSTMGSIARVAVYYTQLAELLSGTEIPVFGALLKGENLYRIQAGKEGIIIIGNESKGIRKNVLPFINRAITIPRVGNAESLNAAVATGIILSHLVVQK